MQQDITFLEKKNIEKFVKDKIHSEVRDHCHYTDKYRGTAYSICNLRLNVPSEIFVVFHNGSNCKCHFCIKELVKEFEEQFECSEKNPEKYKTFSVPKEKAVK